VGGTYGVDEGVDPTAGLGPDLLAEGYVAEDGVVVVELVAPPTAGLGRYLSGSGDHALDEGFGDPAGVAGEVLDYGSEGPHRAALLDAEGVGEHDVEPIPERRAHEGQRDAGRAGGVLDDSVAGTQPPVPGGAFDGCAGHPVFHAPGRVGPLQLGHDPRRPEGDHPDQLDEGGVPDASQCASRCRIHDPPRIVWRPTILHRNVHDAGRRYCRRRRSSLYGQRCEPGERMLDASVGLTPLEFRAGGRIASERFGAISV
jgi:hypothetical protein